MNTFELEAKSGCKVFKTNVKDKLAASRLVYILEHFNGINDWNLDMDDHDRVLRLDYDGLHFSSFYAALSVFDIQVEELPIW